MPEAKVELTGNEIMVTELLVQAKMVSSKSEAKTLITQGGISIDDEKVTDVFSKINISQFEKGYVIAKKGKKVFIKITI